MQKKQDIETISMSHGSGTGLSHLLDQVILPNLVPDGSGPLEDAAVLEAGAGRIAFTTDSFVVQPLEFPGGDIGKLAACGTINDLAVMGAVPEYISVSLILEEGLCTDLLARLLRSLRTVCDATSVKICCGDTKVVNRGKGDGIFINTAGIGFVPDGICLSAANAQAGDAVLVSGSIARHGIAILSQRETAGFESEVTSDCAPLNGLCSTLLEAVPETRVIRDATRGGCAAVLNEIAAASGVSIQLNKADIPVDPAVEQAAAFMGMDPLQIANEGTFVAVVPAEAAQRAIEVLQWMEGGEAAAVIGQVAEASRFPVTLKTEIGGTRPVEVPPGELLPRIC